MNYSSGFRLSLCSPFLILFVVGLIQRSFAQEYKADPLAIQIEKADKLAQEKFSSENWPGLVVVAASDGKVIFSKAYGYSDIENQIALDPAKHLFRIGSISKTLTSVALGQLIESGSIDPDAEIQQYVPYFPRKEYPITVRQVAGHIAGIRHYNGMEFLLNEYFPDVRSSLNIFKDSPLLFEPETKYSYSSYGWNLLSAVIEEAAGTPFLEYMQSMVFDRAGMKDTHPERKGEFKDQKVKFYYKDDEGNNLLAPEVDNSCKWAGGGFIGTATDLVIFADAVQKEKLFSAAIFDQLKRSQILRDGNPTKYGMGWRSDTDEEGRQWTGHSGGSVGGTSMFLYYPESRLCVVTLVNLSSAKMNNLAWQLAGLFLELTKK